MKPTKCPKCCSRLEPIVYANIEVDRCVCCQGIWFDSLEAEILKNIPGSEVLDRGNPCLGSKLNRIEKELICPRCGGKMVRMLDIDLYSIWYEKCAMCHGIWLDAGEFRQFKENFRCRSWWERVLGGFKGKGWIK